MKRCIDWPRHLDNRGYYFFGEIINNIKSCLSEYWTKGNIISWPDICRPNRPAQDIPFCSIHISFFSIFTYTWFGTIFGYIFGEIISFLLQIHCQAMQNAYKGFLAGVNCSQILIFILWFFPSAKLKFSEINFVTCWIFYYLIKKYLAKY